MKTNILITGKPGIGKTTLIKKIMCRIDNYAGFFTEEIRENNIRKGFKIKTTDGIEGILAHKEYKSSFKVGSYYVNIEDLDNIAVRSIEEALHNESVKIVIIDEIGKMELFSKKFQKAVIDVLNSKKIVLGIIKEKPNLFTDTIKMRNDVEIFTQTMENRDGLVEKIVERILDFK